MTLIIYLSILLKVCNPAPENISDRKEKEQENKFVRIISTCFLMLV